MIVVESKFDSDVFGYKVGKAEVHVGAPIRRPLTPFDVVFVKVDGWVYPEIYVALDHRYEMELPQSPPPSGEAFAVAPGEALKRLAKESFVGSRFFRDGRLCGNAPELYARWLEDGGRCWTLPGFSDDAFLLQAWDGNISRISLIAVRDRLRGTGLGRKLMESVLSSTQTPWRVCVSAGNVQAVRFYLSAGFRIVSCSTVYHIWA